MMMALLALLAVTMVSTVVIRAALANAGRIRSGKLEEQAFLTVSSAAAALRDGMQGKVYSRGVLAVRTDTLTEGEVSLTGTPAYSSIREWSDADGGDASPLETLLQDMAEQIIAGGGRQTQNLTVEVTTADGALQPVEAALTMYAGDGEGDAFTVQMELHLRGGGQNDACLTLRLPAVGEVLADREEVRDYVGDDGVSYREVKNYTAQWKISWLDGSIQRKGAAGGAGA